MDGRKRPRQAKRIRHDCFVQSSDSDSTSAGSYEEEDESIVQMRPSSDSVSRSRRPNKRGANVALLEESTMSSKEPTLANKGLSILSAESEVAIASEHKHHKRKKEEMGDETELQDESVAVARTNLELRDECAKLQEASTKAAMSDVRVSEKCDDLTGESTREGMKVMTATGSSDHFLFHDSNEIAKSRSSSIASTKKTTKHVDAARKSRRHSLTGNQQGITSTQIPTIDQQLRLLNQATSTPLTTTKTVGSLMTETPPAQEATTPASKQSLLKQATEAKKPPPQLHQQRISNDQTHPSNFTTVPVPVSEALLTNEAALRVAIADLQRQIQQARSTIPNQQLPVQQTRHMISPQSHHGTRLESDSSLHGQLLSQALNLGNDKQSGLNSQQSDERLEQYAAVQSMFHLRQQQPPRSGQKNGVTPSQGHHHDRHKQVELLRQTNGTDSKEETQSQTSLQDANTTLRGQVAGANSLGPHVTRSESDESRLPKAHQLQPIVNREAALRTAISEIERQIVQGAASFHPLASSSLQQPSQANDVQATITMLLQQYKEASARYAVAAAAAAEAAAEQSSILERFTSFQAQDLVQALQVQATQPVALRPLLQLPNASLRDAERNSISATNRLPTLNPGDNIVQSTRYNGYQLAGLSSNELAILSQLLTANPTQLPVLSVLSDMANGRNGF